MADFLSTNFTRRKFDSAFIATKRPPFGCFHNPDLYEIVIQLIMEGPHPDQDPPLHSDEEFAAALKIVAKHPTLIHCYNTKFNGIGGGTVGNSVVCPHCFHPFVLRLGVTKWDTTVYDDPTVPRGKYTDHLVEIDDMYGFSVPWDCKICHQPIAFTMRCIPSLKKGKTTKDRQKAGKRVSKNIYGMYEDYKKQKEEAGYVEEEDIVPECVMYGTGQPMNVKTPPPPPPANEYEDEYEQYLKPAARALFGAADNAEVEEENEDVEQASDAEDA